MKENEDSVSIEGNNNNSLPPTKNKPVIKRKIINHKKDSNLSGSKIPNKSSISMNNIDKNS